MRPCPACRSDLRVFEVEGLQLDTCPACRGIWFDGGELEGVVAKGALQALLDGAAGRPGQCKGCGAKLERVAECPKCRLAAPACPECGNAPLSVGTVRGVAVDVCTPCGGLWLDAGELEKIAGAEGKARLIARTAALPPVSAPEGGRTRTVCAGCDRQLRKNHAFECNGQIYCGSCAPTGAVPVVPELTRRSASLEEPHLLLGRSDGVLGDGVDVLTFLYRLFR